MQTNNSLKAGILQQVLDCFVNLTGIRVIYFGDFRKFVDGKNTNSCRFCAIIQEYPWGLEGCIRSDMAAFQKSETARGYYHYRCHMGLHEVVVPIYTGKQHAGFLMLGQVRSLEDPDKHWGEIESIARSFQISPDKLENLKEAFLDIDTVSEEKIETSAKMLEMIAQYTIDADTINLYYMKTIEKAKRYINHHFKEHISTETIAGIIGLSPSYLSRLFRKETGYTITAYIDFQRLNYARELLATTLLSIKGVAAMSGYSDQNYFSRVFKKHEGISPVQYRNKNRKL